LRPDFRLEAAAGGRVAGVDEAGRGPLAGPVLAAAVVFPAGVPAALAALLDDSKRLNAAARRVAFAALAEARRTGVAEWAVAAASVAEIGRLNILGATHLAMTRAVARLPRPPDLVLVDGNRAPPAGFPSACPLACPKVARVRCVVGGDGLSLSIAAASILAKVVRDRAMARLDPRWPEYGFAVHAGYPTARHRAALAIHGACPHHRRGFAPVEAALEAALEAAPVRPVRRLG
jgi:ribonuclease HII